MIELTKSEGGKILVPANGWILQEEEDRQCTLKFVGDVNYIYLKGTYESNKQIVEDYENQGSKAIGGMFKGIIPNGCHDTFTNDTKINLGDGNG